MFKNITFINKAYQYVKIGDAFTIAFRNYHGQMTYVGDIPIVKCENYERLYAYEAYSSELIKFTSLWDYQKTTGHALSK